MQQPVAGRGDEGPRGPQPVGAALGAAMVDLLARSDPAARRRNVRDAFRTLEQGHTHGKIVLRP